MLLIDYFEYTFVGSGLPYESMKERHGFAHIELMLVHTYKAFGFRTCVHDVGSYLGCDNTYVQYLNELKYTFFT